MGAAASHIHSGQQGPDTVVWSRVGVGARPSCPLAPTVPARELGHSLRDDRKGPGSPTSACSRRFQHMPLRLGQLQASSGTVSFVVSLQTQGTLAFTSHLLASSFWKGAFSEDFW